MLWFQAIFFLLFVLSGIWYLVAAVQNMREEVQWQDV